MKMKLEMKLQIFKARTANAAPKAPFG